jgi:uncharacterized protein with HEPN domain
VVRNLQVIGASSKRVSADLKTSATKIPWKSISGLRNVLVHDYLGVDLERVWNVVEADLGDLSDAVASVLSAPPASPD